MCRDKCVLASLVLVIAVLPAVAMGQAESRPAGPTSTSAPAEAADNESDSGVIADNLKILLDRHWLDVVGAMFLVTITVVLWAIGLGVLGLILGLVVYFYLRRRGLFRVAPDRRGRFGWVWAIVFPLSFAFGGVYGGGWLGLDRGIKNEILSRRAVDGLIVSIMQANVLHAADFELTGKETPEELQEIVAQSDAMAELVMGDFMAMIDEAIDEHTKDWSARWIVDIARAQVRKKVLKQLENRFHGVDPRLLAIVIFQSNDKKYLDKYPQAKPVAALFAGFLNAIRQDACRRVSGFTRFNIWTGLIGCPLIPLVALLIFRAAVRPRPPA